MCCAINKTKASGTESRGRKIAAWMQATHFELGPWGATAGQGRGRGAGGGRAAAQTKASMSQNGKNRNREYMYTMPLSKSLSTDLRFTQIFEDIRNKQRLSTPSLLRPVDSTAENLGLVPSSGTPGFIVDGERLRTISRIAFSNRTKALAVSTTPSVLFVSIYILYVSECDCDTAAIAVRGCNMITTTSGKFCSPQGSRVLLKW